MNWIGGCPVLHGTKWAANLWVWNRPRWVPPAPGTTSGAGGVAVSNPLGVAGGEALAGVDRSTPIKVEFTNTKGVTTSQSVPLNCLCRIFMRDLD